MEPIEARKNIVPLLLSAVYSQLKTVDPRKNIFKK